MPNQEQRIFLNHDNLEWKRQVSVTRWRESLLGCADWEGRVQLEAWVQILRGMLARYSNVCEFDCDNCLDKLT
jgi:hypothetical protein